MCDTIDFWIATKRASVVKMFKSVDAVVINDEEAKLLTKEFNLVKCAKKIMGWGTKYVIIKKGEHGSLLFFEDVVFPSAAFSLEKVVDPTGAGDSFAGAMMGYLTSKNKTDLATIKKSMIYGNVMGSFAVEGYEPEFGEPVFVQINKLHGKLAILSENSFFDKPRTVSETVNELRERGWVVNPLDVSKVLAKMAFSKELSKGKQADRSFYFVQKEILTN